MILHLLIQLSGFAEIFLSFTNPWLKYIPNLFSIVLLAFPVIIGSQIYRYFRVSTPIERLQTKWFLAGIILYWLLSGLISELAGATMGKSSGIAGDIDELLALMIPISIGIAILRYRLWDIEVLIRRTIVYSLLTAVLAFVYFGFVTILQAVISTITGEQSTAAIVISTLAIAGLFYPMRKFIQTLIDRRFYRSKYDAQKTMEKFATSARNETDLERLSEELLQAIQGTVQPLNVSLWMKPVSRVGNR